MIAFGCIKSMGHYKAIKQREIQPIIQAKSVKFMSVVLGKSIKRQYTYCMTKLNEFVSLTNNKW